MVLNRPMAWGRSPGVNVRLDAVEVLIAQVVYQMLHLPLVGQDEEGHGISYIVLYQHPAGQITILLQVKFTRAFDHGHQKHLARIQAELMVIQ